MDDEPCWVDAILSSSRRKMSRPGTFQTLTIAPTDVDTVEKNLQQLRRRARRWSSNSTVTEWRHSAAIRTGFVRAKSKIVKQKTGAKRVRLKQDLSSPSFDFIEQLKRGCECSVRRQQCVDISRVQFTRRLCGYSCNKARQSTSSNDPYFFQPPLQMSRPVFRTANNPSKLDWNLCTSTAGEKLTSAKAAARREDKHLRTVISKILFSQTVE